MYCGLAVEISHPLLPMGIKTPISIFEDMFDNGLVFVLTEGVKGEYSGIKI